MSKTARVIIILIVCSLIFPSCGKALQRACEYINQIIQSPEFAEAIDAIVAAIFSACVKMYDAFVAWAERTFATPISPISHPAKHLMYILPSRSFTCILGFLS